MNSRTTSLNIINVRTRGKKTIAILLMGDKRKTSGISYFFTLRSVFNSSRFSSKVQILLDVLARMALLSALHKKLQLQKVHALKASKNMSSTSQ